MTSKKFYNKYSWILVVGIALPIVCWISFVLALVVCTLVLVFPKVL